MSDVLTVGDRIDVKLIEATRDGKYRLSRKAVTHPESYVPPAPRGDSRGGGDRDRRGGGDRDRRSGGDSRDRRR